MSSDPLIYAVAYVGMLGAADAITFYAGYLSLAVSRGLAVPAYRSRALGMSAFAILIGVALTFSGNVNTVFPPAYYGVGAAAVYLLLYPAVLAVLFIWIDRTINTVFRLDYLRRDILGWRRFRLVYWGFVAASFVVYFISYFDFVFSVYLAYDLFILVPLAYASVLLVVGSAKTRDATFRSHAKWFGYCLVVILLTSILYLFTTDLILDALPDVPLSFCIYKMARHLVPVGRFPSG